jgi:septum site-determining protein MinC
MTVVSESLVQKEDTALEIKATTFTLPVIRLFRLTMADITIQVEEKISQAPDLFRHAPVVVDLTELAQYNEELDIVQLIDVLRRCNMVPIGLRGGNAAQQKIARDMDLAILSEVGKSRGRNNEVKTDDDLVPHSNSGTGSILISRPVRSGQKVYASGGDLTVIAAVSSGAELMADGNIHVYAPLRGRVFAGIKGNRESRIFCQNLQAELVAVAGHYRVNENIPAELKGARVQIFLENDMLRIEPF